MADSEILKNESGPIYRHAVEIQVRFSDVDFIGHVSNSVYQSYYDIGKLSYVNQIFGPLNWRQLGMVGASMKIDYIKPIYMGSQIKVLTRIAKIGQKSMIFTHRIIDQENEDIMSTCEAITVCYLPQEQRSIPVPDEWRQKIAAFEKGYLPETAPSKNMVLA